MIKLTLWRNESYDLSQCIRKLPYSGKSWFAVKTIHVPRLKEWFQAMEHFSPFPVDFSNISYMEIPTKQDFSKIKAINIKEADAYTTGDSDKIPTLFDFNVNAHIISWNDHEMLKMGFTKHEIKRFGGSPYVPVLDYHLLVQK